MTADEFVYRLRREASLVKNNLIIQEVRDGHGFLLKTTSHLIPEEKKKIKSILDPTTLVYWDYSDYRWKWK